MGEGDRRPDGLHVAPALVVVVWPGRLELPVLGDRPVGRAQLAVIAAFATGWYEDVAAAAAAVAGDPEDPAFRELAQPLVVWGGVTGAAGVERVPTARDGRDGTPADPAPLVAESEVVATPLSVHPRGDRFEVVGHDGDLLIALDLDELLALPQLATAGALRGGSVDPAVVTAIDPGRAERLAARLREVGLLRPAPPSRSVFVAPSERQERQRAAFGAAAARADEEERARRARTGVVRPEVVPVSFTNGPPLALGLIVAHCLQDPELADRFHFRREWEWDDDRLERCTSAPAVYLCSAYVWSHQQVLRVAAAVKERSPTSVVVVGGPDAPKRSEAADRYLHDHPEVDVIVRGEGEETARELLRALGTPHAGAGTFDLEPLRSVPGLTVRIDGEVVRTEDRPRLADLDQVPSPFLTGLFDTYRDAPLDQVVLESNRGCPYGCTFCDWGSATQSRIRRFDLDRVFAEIDWCAAAGAQVISFADANFGIFARDVEIAERVTAARAATSYPIGFGANFAKNTVKHLRPIIRTLVEGGIVNRGLLALQTTDQATLDVIERTNIPTERYDAVAAEMRSVGLPFAVELMMGLPGATVASFKSDLQQCIDREVEGTVNPTSVLVNSPMNEPAYLARHRIETGVEVTPGAHALVVATETFTREEYRYMVALRRTFLLGENFGVTRHIDRLVRAATGIREIDVLEQLHRDVTGRDGGDRFPYLRGLFTQPSPTLVVPVSWRFLVDDLVAWVTDRFPAVDRAALATVATVQHAMLPALDRTYPAVVPLDHDYAAWFAEVVAAKEAGHLADWPERVAPLTAFGPGVLHVDDPNGSARRNVGCSVDHGPLLASWEHESEVGRALFSAASRARPGSPARS